MDILLGLEHDAVNLDEQAIRELAIFALEALDLPENTEVSITFVTDQRIAELNEAFRGKTGPTDVLSFECDNLEDGFPLCDEDRGVYSLGDVIIAPDVARRQAQELGNAFSDEISLLLVHGLLHLIGHDHIHDDEAQRMEELQSYILTNWAQRDRTERELS